MDTYGWDHVYMFVSTRFEWTAAVHTDHIHKTSVHTDHIHTSSVHIRRARCHAVLSTLELRPADHRRPYLSSCFFFPLPRHSPQTAASMTEVLIVYIFNSSRISDPLKLFAVTTGAYELCLRRGMRLRLRYIYRNTVMVLEF
ncbi:hypothetical protein YC2023_023622 [Brassica napus]